MKLIVTNKNKSKNHIQILILISYCSNKSKNMRWIEGKKGIEKKKEIEREEDDIRTRILTKKEG